MDWPRLISELIDSGMTQVQIADECGVAQASISALSRGLTKVPNFTLGTKLTALRALRVRSDEDDAVASPRAA